MKDEKEKSDAIRDRMSETIASLEDDNRSLSASRQELLVDRNALVRRLNEATKRVDGLVTLNEEISDKWEKMQRGLENLRSKVGSTWVQEEIDKILSGTWEEE